MSKITIEIENYTGSTLTTIDLPFFDLADMESNSHFRIQSEHMDQQHTINIIRKSLEKALKELDEYGF